MKRPHSLQRDPKAAAALARLRDPSAELSPAERRALIETLVASINPGELAELLMPELLGSASDPGPCGCDSRDTPASNEAADPEMDALADTEHSDENKGRPR